MGFLAGLSRQRDFQRLFRQGRRQRGRLLTLVAAPSAEPGALRAAVVCSRRVGKATVRNRVRRRLRHALRELSWRTEASADLAVIAHPQAAAASFAELDRDLRRAVARAGLAEDNEGLQ